MAFNLDGEKAQRAEEIDCERLERMSLAEMLYHVLTGDGSPFQIVAAGEAGWAWSEPTSNDGTV